MRELDEALGAELAALEERGRRRQLRRLEGAPGPRFRNDGREVLNFGSNNYLGLTEHPEVRAAAVEAAREWGTGSTGSRLLSGNLPLHEALEAELAAFLGSEAALLFSSGYLAAVGTVPALAGSGDLILSDALNHASLIDGCRLSRAEVRVYRHADVAHAAALLSDRGRFRRCLVVTDGVFSMDGTTAPARELAALAERHDATLMVDDAHGIGVLGPGGGGLLDELGIAGRVAVRMGTLSKAFAAEGGFVAGSRVLVEWLRNRARSAIFSTAPAPPSVAAARAALRIVRREPARRRGLARRARWLRATLLQLGLRVPAGSTPVIPIVVGENAAAVSLSERLEALGVWAPAVRPPSVPEGTARLRLCVMATHTPGDLRQAASAVRQATEGGTP